MLSSFKLFLHSFYFLLYRETNKAFCGFLDSSKYQHCSKIFQDADENNNEVSTANCNIFPVRIINKMFTLVNY